MSEEQFERLLKAIAEARIPHVCPPCTRMHYPYWTPTWYPPYTVYSNGTPYTVYSNGTLSTNGNAITKVEY
jgi:hypothetical protein